MLAIARNVKYYLHEWVKCGHIEPVEIDLCLKVQFINARRQKLVFGQQVGNAAVGIGGTQGYLCPLRTGLMI